MEGVDTRSYFIHDLPVYPLGDGGHEGSMLLEVVLAYGLARIIQRLQVLLRHRHPSVMDPVLIIMSFVLLLLFVISFCYFFFVISFLLFLFFHSLLPVIESLFQTVDLKGKLFVISVIHQKNMKDNTMKRNKTKSKSKRRREKRERRKEKGERRKEKGYAWYSGVASILLHTS